MLRYGADEAEAKALKQYLNEAGISAGKYLRDLVRSDMENKGKL